ncbi:MAG: class I SAM-dependent methyltransferase [Chloroflexota bacterium]|nr:class I SAM-dependent methyltransferase [Chloroflexota bacterium]
MTNPLTDETFWDEHWRDVRLPVEVREATATPHQNEILKIFKAFLPIGHNLAVLEVGGAPGQYLAYVVRSFGYTAHAIDSSAVGCRKLEENFRLLQLRVTVHHKDILRDDLWDMAPFDVVYSLGLVEHFTDPLPVVIKHVELTKPGGTIVIGMPNFLGVNRWLLERFRPDVFKHHNLATMDLRAWSRFERQLPVQRLFSGYVGGWEPRMYASTGSPKPVSVSIGAAARLADHIPSFRRLNSKWWSGYVMVVYRRSEASAPSIKL